MPSRAVVDAFIAHVCSGDHVGAIRDWYAEDAFMQENQGPRRVGRETLMQHEARALARMQRIDTELVEAPMIDGDRVAIHWRFTLVPKQGEPATLEEIAWQVWRGDKVAEEVFFYDPAQLQALRSAQAPS
jgi:hypothetical protein